METANKELRQYMKAHGITYWRVAEMIGVCEYTVLRWLRTELNDEKRTLIEDAVHKLIEQQTN